MHKYLLLLLAIVSTQLSAQQIQLFEQFNGRYDYTAFGNTLNTVENGGSASCTILTQSSANFALSASQTLVAARLYWSGSGTGDFDVALNGTPVSALRTFGLTSGQGLPYFSAFADVTSILQTNGQGVYTLSDLDLTAVIGAYCGNTTNYGGWAVMVIYEDPSLTLNQISLFDGLESVSGDNPSLSITINNIDVASQDLAKIGFLAWEGDQGLANNETLRINGTLIGNPPLNPDNNAFNGTNSYTNSPTLYNMDLDFFDIMNVIMVGDTSATIELTSNQDFVMVNNIITSINSENPDATIVIDNLGVLCENNNIDVNYTVSNLNSTSLLPANTPIAIYLNATLVAQTLTVADIPIGGSESGSVTLNLPPGTTPNNFNLTAVVDDDGTGVGIVSETDESNNEFILPVDLSMQGLDLGPDRFPCDLSQAILGMPLGINFSYQWFLNNTMINGATGATFSPSVDGTYKLEARNGICFVEDEVVVTFQSNPVASMPDDLFECDEAPNDGFAEFDLTQRDAQIQNGAAGTSVFYFEDEDDAEDNINPILNPTNYTNTIIGVQIIYARLEESTYMCGDVVPLTLRVFNSPVIQNPIDDYVECDNDMDGSEVFDLTSKDVEILDGLVGVTLTYHTTEADAEAGVAAIGTPDMYPSAGELIWVRAQNYENGDPTGTPLCATVGSFNLVLGGVLNFTEVDTFEQCDVNGDGSEDFDLSDQNATITNGDANLNVGYYATQADAMSETMALAIPYPSTGEQIWVRVESSDEGCFVTFSMDLVVSPGPVIGMPDPLVFCDDNNDGFGSFILSNATNQVLNGNPAGNLMVSYHISLADANNNVLPLPTMTPFNNDMIGMQTIHVRLSDSASSCYSLTTLNLLVRDSPAITPPDPLILCDDDTDGRGIFDLTEAEAMLFIGLDASLYSVTYYDDAGLTNAINTPETYPNTSNPQTIFIVVANNDPGMPSNTCERQTTVELQVISPAVLVDPTPLEECDDDQITGPNDELEFFDLSSKIDEIRGGNPAINITFFETLAGAQDGSMPINPATMYQNTSNPQTIFIRAQDTNTGCVVADGMVTLDLIVNPVPVLTPPSALTACDDDTDGFVSTFMLEDNNAEITTDPDVTFSYHETLADAQNNTFAVSSPYENVVAFNQPIYVRVTYTNPPNDTGCFSIIQMDLEVLPTPQIAPLNNLEICDDDDMAIFNLNDQDAAIYNGQSMDFILTYHTSQGDADAGTNDITNTGAFPNVTNPQTIYVRFESDVNGCFNTSDFDLVVNLGPAVTDPTQLMLCDDVGQTNDGFTSFDLTQKNDEITGAVPGVSVEYYLTMQDAQDAIDRIDPETDFTNTVNPQIVFVRVIAANGCVDFTTLELRVTANPEPVTPMALELCDDNNPGDGIEVFNLASTRATILNGASWVVTYHATYQDAFDGMPLVLDELAYPNVVPGMDVAYARATNMTTGCFEIVEITLIVNPLPDDTAIVEDYIICEVPFDGVATFNLTSRIPEILGPDQDPGDYTVTFYLDAMAAISGSPIIGNASTYQNISNPQTIFTGIENNTTGCYSAGVQSFVIEVRAGAEATMPQDPFIICDNEGANDGIGSFNLDDVTDAQVADLRAEILGGQPEPDFVITFHETSVGAVAGTGAISFPYNNLLNPQRIYVRVTNSLTDCFATTQMLLQVDVLPVVTLDETYRICVDENDMVVMEEEGQPSPPTIDTGLDPTLYTFEWDIDGTVQVDQTGPSIVPVVGGMYTVTVTDIATGCINIASTTVIVSSAPRTFSATLINGAFANNHIIEAEATGLGVYVFQLDDGQFQSSGTFENVRPGTHIITIKDASGCGSVEIVVNVIDYPEFMTPNQDGYHDTWNIIGIAEGDPTAKIYIFDRYGKLLKQLSPQSEGWDGTYNGNPLPSSDYWFRVEYMEDDKQKEFKGHFTLKR